MRHVGTPKVLVVDDEEWMREACVEILQPEGFVGRIEPVAQRADPTIRFVDDWPRSLPTITAQHSAKPPLDMQPATLLKLSGKAA